MNTIKKINEMYGEMSESQQKIAKFITSSFKEAVFDSIDSYSKKTGISKSTIVRFAYFLGYDGFKDMQQRMQEEFSASHSNDESVDSSENSFKSSIDNTISKIAQMCSEINLDDFEKICKEIMVKENILIVGYLESFGVAAQLLHSLDAVRNNVYFLRLITDWGDIFKLMGENSAVIAISFTPHYKPTFDCVQMAKDKGATIITISDSYINPLNKFSDYMMVFNLNKIETLNMTDSSPVIAFINYMMDYLYKNYKEKIDYYINNEKRFEEYIE